jgi:four helix bundle protein
MSGSKEIFRTRTKQFALRVIRLVQHLPDDNVSRVISNQLLRSGPSVGANYRAACRAKSAADFCSKMANVEEEADESMYWMELVIEGKLMADSRLKPLYREAEEILRMTVASINTARRGLRDAKKKGSPTAAF